MRVDSKLGNSLSRRQMSQLGENVRLPSYNLPFVVCTIEETMLLWAANSKEQAKWVQAFSSLQAGIDTATLEAFKIKKTGKNKFVTSLYDVLKEASDAMGAPPDKVSLRAKTQLPVTRRR